ncbi:acyltransferase family protein [alpha proteobacterium HIMB5]|nr:acyltransferase family protein [alpha proteobacterium HIMB5]
MIKLNYRPEIDGLRAISVIAVITYHLKIGFDEIKIFSGGFIGVDIFFVISGYLITLLILKEIEETNSFSILDFYKRRAKRILPALFGMILISVLFAWNYLTPNSFIQYSKSILASIFFFSNYFFYFEGLEYNSDSSLLKPLLHTWSLAVEEQFYIFFPILLIFVLKYLNKNFFGLFIILFIFGLFISFFSTTQNSVFSFFSTLSRIWEFTAGSLIAYFELNNKKPKLINNSYSFILGIILIFLSFLYFDNGTIHPSFYTLLPVLGTVLVIGSTDANSLLKKMLSNFIMVKIGLISYSLYLWHFPILAFARNRGKNLSDFDKLELVGLTVVLSILSYLIIEKPFRRIKQNFNFFSILIVLLSSIFIILNFISKKTNGFENRIHVFLKNTQRVLLEDNMKDNKGRCFDRTKDFCNYDLSSKTNVFLIGDSHMEVLSENLYKKVVSKKLNYTTMNRGTCIYLPNFKKINKIDKKEIKNCTEDSKKLIDNTIYSKPGSIVILGGNLSKHFNEQDQDWKYETSLKIKPLESYVNSIKKMLDNDLKVILVYPIPGPKFHVIKRLMNDIPKTTYNASKYLINNPLTFDLNEHYKENEKIINSLDKLSHKNLIKVIPEKRLCNLEKNICYTHDDKDIFYSDGHHLAQAGVKKIVEDISLSIDIFLND